MPPPASHPRLTSARFTTISANPIPPYADPKTASSSICRVIDASWPRRQAKMKPSVPNFGLTRLVLAVSPLFLDQLPLSIYPQVTGTQPAHRISLIFDKPVSRHLMILLPTMALLRLRPFPLPSFFLFLLSLLSPGDTLLPLVRLVLRLYRRLRFARYWLFLHLTRRFTC